MLKETDQYKDAECKIKNMKMSGYFKLPKVAELDKPDLILEPPIQSSDEKLFR